MPVFCLIKSKSCFFANKSMPVFCLIKSEPFSVAFLMAKLVKDLTLSLAISTNVLSIGNNSLVNNCFLLSSWS